jgi:hypothetical protein
MFKQKPFPASIVVLLILMILHLVGSYYSLYWVYPWYDILAHIGSGLWIALTLLWLASVLGQINSLKEYKTKTFLIALLSAILIGVIWEIMEKVSGASAPNSIGYRLDTAMDIVNDGLGGLLAFWYFVRRARRVDNTAEVLHPFYNQTGIIKS